jgi:hypothetical protein
MARNPTLLLGPLRSTISTTKNAKVIYIALIKNHKAKSASNIKFDAENSYSPMNDCGCVGRTQTPSSTQSNEPLAMSQPPDVLTWEAEAVTEKL